MAKLAGLNVGVSEETLRRVRDYAVNEPSFTAPFAAWDLSQTGEPISAEAVRLCMPALLKQGIIEVVEDGGRFGRVYAYAPPPTAHPALNARRLFAELDDSRIGELRPAQVVVPHTREEGKSDRPGRNKKRQAKGVRIKRGRQGS